MKIKIKISIKIKTHENQKFKMRTGIFNPDTIALNQNQKPFYNLIIEGFFEKCKVVVITITFYEHLRKFGSN